MLRVCWHIQVKESLWSLCCAVWDIVMGSMLSARRQPGVGGRCGQAVVSFGEPLSIKRFLKVRGCILAGMLGWGAGLFHEATRCRRKHAH